MGTHILPLSTLLVGPSPMADFHKLLDSHSLNLFVSLPFHVSPHPSFSISSFSPPRRLSCLPIFCRPSFHSNSPSSSLTSRTEIVSTTECSDGSFLFKFGDPSEIVEIDEDVNDSGDSDLGKGEGLAEDNKAGSTSKAVDKERSDVNDSRDTIDLHKEEDLAHNKAGSISKAVDENRSDVNDSSDLDLHKEENLAQDDKAGSISKAVDEKRSYVNDSSDLDLHKEDNLAQDDKAGSISKAVDEKRSYVNDNSDLDLDKEEDLAEDDKAGSISKAVNKERSYVDDNSALNLDKGEGLGEDNKAGSIYKAGDGERSFIRSTSHCSSDDAVLESNRDGMEKGHMVELTLLHTNVNELCGDSVTGSVGVEAKETSTSMVDIRTVFHEESDGNQIDYQTTSPKSGIVADVETTSASAEEASGEINESHTMTSHVSPELELSSEGCDGSESVKIGENRLNVDSLDSSVHDGGSIVDDYLVELMPKNAKLEANLTLDEEIGNNLLGDLLAPESCQDSIVVDDGACHTILPDVITNGDVGSNGLSDCAVAVEQTDTVARGEEMSLPALALASGVASLTCPSQALTGAEDAYFVAEEKWFIVANSVGEWSFEGTKAGLYGHELLHNCKTLISDIDSCKANVREVLKQSAATVQSPGLVSLLIAHYDNEVLHIANVGDTGFIIVRNGFVHKSSSPLFHEFYFPAQIRCTDDPLEVAKEYHVNLDDGDVIIMATDGLFDNLYEKDIASIVSKSLGANMKPKELAELLATRAQEVGRSKSTRSPFSDEAQAAGYAGYSGGKLDHVTVIVSFVKKQSSPQS